jgi:hypothetical protein
MSVYSRLIQDPRFIYIAAQRYMMTANSAREYAEGAEVAEALLVSVRGALDGGGGD